MTFSAVLLRPESEAFQLPVAASTACSSHPSPSPTLSLLCTCPDAMPWKVCIQRVSLNLLAEGVVFLQLVK